MATLEQLEVRIQKLQQQAEELRRKKSVKVVASIQQLMQEYGLTLADLSGVQTASSGRRRGRPAGSKNVVVGDLGQKRAKRVASRQYANPETGATWSGFGRAPEWIASAPDRSVFLVGVTSAAKSAKSSAPVPKRGAPAKKAVTKKVVAKKAAAKKTVAKKAATKKAGAKVGRKAAAKSTNAAPAKRAVKTAAPAKKARAPRKTARAAVPVAIPPNDAGTQAA